MVAITSIISISIIFLVVVFVGGRDEQNCRLEKA